MKTVDSAFDGSLPGHALARLADGIDLFVESFIDNDNLCGPSWVQMRVDADVVGLLNKHSALCVEHGLAMVEYATIPKGYDAEGSEVHVQHWALRVDKLEFWWRGECKGGIAAETRPMEARDLALAIGCDPLTPDEEMPDGFAWYGGALLYSPDCMDALQDMAREAYPELEARQTEIEMAQSIATVRVTDATLHAEADVAPPVRRRPRA